MIVSRNSRLSPEITFSRENSTHGRGKASFPRVNECEKVISHYRVKRGEEINTFLLFAHPMKRHFLIAEYFLRHVNVLTRKMGKN